MSYDVRMYVAVAVQDRHGDRCPCCGVRMTKRGSQKAVSRYVANARTVAHDEPEKSRTDEGRYVFACARCNGDQKQLTFRMWAARLACRRDPRAEAVAALADEVDRLVERRKLRYGC